MEEKILFVVPLYSQTEKSYDDKWKKKCERAFISNPSNEYTKIEQFIGLQLRIDPKFYKYNDIVGYAELELGYKSISLNYHMNGDLRKKYNQDLKSLRGTTNKIYRDPGTGCNQASSFFSNYNNRSIRQAVNHALSVIAEQCKTWSIVVNIEPYKEKSKYFNFRDFFEANGWL